MLLNDNTVLNGFIRHNDKLRLIKFRKNQNDGDELSFQEKRIIKMEYTDREHAQQRTFLNLNVKDETGLEDAMLFEIVLELREFALLSRKFGVNPAIRDRSNDGVVRHAKVGYEQFEKLYFVGVEGVAELVLVTSEFERDRDKPLPLPMGTFYDQAILKKYIGVRWDAVRRHMRDNDLNPKLKSDLLAILNHYKKLEDESND